MSIVSTFFGIIIRMYWQDQDRHEKPHFHAYYGEQEAIFSLSGTLRAGTFPEKQAALVCAWAIIHEEELKADWRLTQNAEAVFPIEPLR